MQNTTRPRPRHQNLKTVNKLEGSLLRKSSTINSRNISENPDMCQPLRSPQKRRRKASPAFPEMRGWIRQKVNKYTDVTAVGSAR
jgi:hypothetical protein